MDDVAIYANPWTVAAGAAVLSALGAYALRLGASPRRRGLPRILSMELELPGRLGPPSNDGARGAAMAG